MGQAKRRAAYRFEVGCESAGAVYLLLRLHGEFTHLLPMEPAGAGSGRWAVQADLPPGRHGFRFYASEADRLLSLASGLLCDVRVVAEVGSERLEAPLRCAGGGCHRERNGGMLEVIC